MLFKEASQMSPFLWFSQDGGRAGSWSCILCFECQSALFQMSNFNAPMCFLSDDAEHMWKH